MGKHEASKSAKKPIQLKIPDLKNYVPKRNNEHSEPVEIKLPEIKKPDISRARESMLRLFRRRATASSEKRDLIHEYAFSLKNVAVIGVGALLFLLVWLLPTGGWIRIVTFFLPYLVLGIACIRDGLEEMLNRRFLGRSFLILLASIGSFGIGEYPTAVFIMLVFRVCQMVEAFSRERKEELQLELRELRPTNARIASNSGDSEVAPDAVNTTDTIVVRNGETVPVDGMVVDGMTSLELVALTGYRQTIDAAPGSSVYSGMVNRGDDIHVRVTAPAGSSTIQKMVTQSLDAASTVPGSEQGIRYALHLIPACFIVIALIIGLVVPAFAEDWRVWLYRAILLLAVSSTAPMLQALSHNVAGSILRGSLSGIYFKNADALDGLADTSTIVFSKTGTVTEGRYKVESVYSDAYQEKDLLMIAALAEGQSHHPIAQALREACGIGITPREDIHVVEELPSRGITTLFSGRNVYVGNASLLMEHGISFSIPPRNGTVIHVAVDSEYAGHIVLSDRIREGAFDAIEELRLRGAGETVMLTGDVRSTSRQIASSLNFDLVKTELTPEGKISAVEYLKGMKGPRDVLTYVSGSESDLEILKHADVTLGFSALGKYKLCDSVDVAVLGSQMNLLPSAYALSRKAKTRAQQSLILYGAVKMLILLLGVTGIFSIWLAAFLDIVAASLVLLNVSRK